MWYMIYLSPAQKEHAKKMVRSGGGIKWLILIYIYIILKYMLPCIT